jgi:hypothetical protein
MVLSKKKDRERPNKAPANAATCHESCCRTFRAVPSRGSSVTFANTMFVRDTLLSALRELSPKLRRVEAPAIANTAQIISVIEAAARSAGVRTEREVDAGIARVGSSGAERRGQVDLVAWTEKAVYALEVDRSNKRWSLTKLQHLQRTRGWIPIWIRWRNRIAGELPRDVCVIDMCHWELKVYSLPTEEPNKMPDPTSGTVRPRAQTAVAPVPPRGSSLTLAKNNNE